ncbi:hypothetical protein [Wolbachia endosymbiont (group A) of Anomoia purmunda]|nr:hypothetical protein [Wolbachia endosymbiont (group A) of Anomoia purmunda]
MKLSLLDFSVKHWNDSNTAIHSIAVRTLSSRRVSSQRPYDVIPVLDTGI